MARDITATQRFDVGAAIEMESKVGCRVEEIMQ